MKKEYLKPEAEYISLYSEERITDDMNVHAYANNEEGRIESTVWGEGEGDSNWKP